LVLPIPAAAPASDTDKASGCRGILFISSSFIYDRDAHHGFTKDDQFQPTEKAPGLKSSATKKKYAIFRRC
jgi:hypothetical protein